jgi:Domain of unknown function (DUF1918)
MPAKKATAKKSTARKVTPKRGKAKTVTAKTVKEATAKKATAKKGTNRARRGDLIVIDSVHVGSPAREGEILKVIVGQLSVSYQVRWGDGHESFITPVAGTAHIVRT